MHNSSIYKLKRKILNKIDCRLNLLNAKRDAIAIITPTWTYNIVTSTWEVNKESNKYNVGP